MAPSVARAEQLGKIPGVKILVIGSGGREHALVWRLVRGGHEVVAAPGNPGIEQLARCVAVGVEQLDTLVQLAGAERVDLVVVGPEAPLVAGLADRLRAAGISTFGPSASGARLEGSKAFSKDFFARHGIPTARFRTVTTLAEAESAIDDPSEFFGRIEADEDDAAEAGDATRMDP